MSNDGDTGAVAWARPDPELTRAMVPGIRRLLPNLIVAGVMPVVAYALVRPHVGSDTTGLALVLIFPLAEIIYERIRRGYFEPIGMIAIIGITTGLVGAAAMHGNAMMLKVRESMLTGLFGLVCLGSLSARRPVMFVLGRSFATNGEPAKRAEFDQLWDLPGVPARFRFVTLVWGVTLVAEAGIRTVLALDLPTQGFLVVAQIVNWVILGSLLAFTIRYSRDSEERITAALEGLDPATVSAAATVEPRAG